MEAILVAARGRAGGAGRGGADAQGAGQVVSLSGAALAQAQAAGAGSVAGSVAGNSSAARRGDYLFAADLPKSGVRHGLPPRPARARMRVWRAEAERATRGAGTFLSSSAPWLASAAARPSASSPGGYAPRSILAASTLAGAPAAPSPARPALVALPDPAAARAPPPPAPPPPFGRASGDAAAPGAWAVHEVMVVGLDEAQCAAAVAAGEGAPAAPRVLARAAPGGGRGGEGRGAGRGDAEVAGAVFPEGARVRSARAEPERYSTALPGRPGEPALFLHVMVRHRAAGPGAWVPEALVVAARAAMHCTLAAALGAFAEATLECGWPWGEGEASLLAGLLARELVTPQGALSPRPGALPLADVDLAPLFAALPLRALLRLLLYLALAPATPEGAGAEGLLMVGAGGAADAAGGAGGGKEQLFAVAAALEALLYPLPLPHALRPLLPSAELAALPLAPAPFLAGATPAALAAAFPGLDAAAAARAAAGPSGAVLELATGRLTLSAAAERAAEPLLASPLAAALLEALTDFDARAVPPAPPRPAAPRAGRTR